MQGIKVESEIGRLRRVLIHRPGREIDWMVPSMMERLLFDDILYGEQARAEHDCFRGVLEASGVEVLDPQTLLGELLGDATVLGDLLDDLVSGGVPREIVAELTELEAEPLAAALVSGLPSPRGEGVAGRQSFYRLAPVPNFFFQRDPQVVFGDRVLISSMATEAREREPTLARFLFEHHRELDGYSELVRLDHDSETARWPTLEGGDVLVPSPEVLLVGLSERTNRWGVEAFANHLRQNPRGFRSLIVVEIPAKRSYMHLDTVFTFIDEGLCLAYEPVIAASGSEIGHVYRIDLQAKDLAYNVCADLPRALRDVGIDIELVPCGGSKSLIDQQREQWTDGANAFALAPGVITLYRRNRRTTEELDRRGFRIIDEEDVVAGKVEVLGHGRTAVTLLGNELSRARGGPRCMTMPLERES